jgi:hypothetical protein
MRQHHVWIPTNISEQRLIRSSRSGTRSFSNTNNKDALPPLPPSTASSTSTNTSSAGAATVLSPAKAKQQYLAKLRATEGYQSSSSSSPPLPSSRSSGSSSIPFQEDPHVKLARLAQEIDTIKLEQAKKLDAELNKSVWRKLTDPLRRYKHSLVNVVVVTLAYVLAHKLYMNSKREQQVALALEESQQETHHLQQILSSLLKEQVIQEIATQCVQELVGDEEEEIGTSRRRLRLGVAGGSTSWWRRSRGKSSGHGWLQQYYNDEDVMVESLVPVLHKALQQRIGDASMPEEERKRKALQQLVAEQKDKVKAQKEEERAFFQALAEATSRTTTTTTEETVALSNGKQVVQKRVFSM